MEGHIRQLQLELAEARQRSGIYTDEASLDRTNSEDVSSFVQVKGTHLNVNEDGTLSGNSGVLPNGSVDDNLPFAAINNPPVKVSMRKNKEEAPKDVSHSSGELSDERKMGRVQSKDHRRQDEFLSSTNKPLGGSPEVEHSAVKQTPLASGSTFGQSSSTKVIDQNLSSPHNSPRNTTDDDDDDVDAYADGDADEDDACGVAGPATRTLPGLLHEIMSKGKRMTYEELCNAVLPHWNNLRKHNGERYAYSSHSQAVLDCLRNRNEWARLVDRGPKTNAGRKKRRPDSEPPLVEPEENEYSKSRITKELVGKQFDAHTEDFPKGKRKARKRRRLALQGRGIRDVRKRQKTNAVTDEDLGPFSHSSDNGGAFSEDSQGARTRPNGSEVSGSSDEADQ